MGGHSKEQDKHPESIFQAKKENASFVTVSVLPALSEERKEAKDFTRERGSETPPSRLKSRRHICILLFPAGSLSSQPPSHALTPLKALC